MTSLFLSACAAMSPVCEQLRHKTGEKLIASNSGAFRPDRAAEAHNTFSASFAEHLLEAAALALAFGQGLNSANERAHGLMIPLALPPHELFLEIRHKRRVRRPMQRGFTGGGHVVCM